MISRSVVVEVSRQRSSGCELRRPDRLCRARLPISSDSLARSATEIRDMRRLSPAPILSFYPQDSERERQVQYAAVVAEMRSLPPQPRGEEAVQPAPARL